ncbi:hypothetical protein [Tepidibacillus marianensis]|uniref:hypothetical protein n=1 Tax=Tepidibacillus marianensis TaxID=3131995 RepID=UPI0030CE6FDD
MNQLKNKQRLHEDVIIEIELLTHELLKLEANKQALEETYSQYEKANHYLQTYQRIKEIEWKLKELKEIPDFPERGIERLEMHESKINELQIEKRQLESKQSNMTQQVEQLNQQSLKDTQKQRIAMIRDQFPYYKQNKERSTQLQNENNFLIEKIEENKKMLGKFYQEDLFRSFEYTISDKQKLQSLIYELDKQDKELLTISMKIEEYQRNRPSDNLPLGEDV